MKSPVFRRLLGLLCAPMLFSCITVESRCPYAVEAVSVKSPPDADCALAALCFTVCNNAAKTLTGLCICLTLCTKEGECALEDVIVALDGLCIAGGERLLCSAPLDAYFSEAPTEALFVESLYVQQIRYADGSAWKDPFGFYADGFS